MRAIRQILLGAIVTTTAIGVAPAGAATQLGDTVTGTNNCPGSGTTLNVLVSPPYLVPAPGGVVTRIGFNSADAETVSLKIVRSTDGTNRYSSGPLPVTTGGSISLPVRVPVVADDKLAVWNSGPISTCRAFSGSTIWTRDAATDPPNMAGSYTTISNVRMPISATLESDIDGDGFGDETQDLCPSQAGTQGPCVAARTCKVPSLKGKTKSAAKKALESAGCKLGKTKSKKLKKFSKKQKRNRVRTQSLGTGSVTFYGASVDITVNTKKRK